MVNTEKRFVFIPSQKRELEPAPHPGSLHRSKSTTQPTDNNTQRGRPQVARIHTDVRAGLEGMVTGHRRTPSPYAYQSAALTEALAAGPRSKNQLLSPMHAQEARRPTSIHPGTHPAEHDSSDSDHKSKPKKRPEQYQSRDARQSFSPSDRSEPERTTYSKMTVRDSSPENKSSRRVHRYRSPAPPPGGFVGYSYTGQDDMTPPQTPKLL